MRQKCNQLVSILIIVILLPCIITVFLNGPSVLTNAKIGNDYIKVKQKNGTAEVSLDTYCMGILAKEMDITYEEEALKAQALLVRTSVYKQMTEHGKEVVFEEGYWTENHMEEYWGKSYKKNYGKLQNAWESTAGQVVTYNGQPAYVPFHQLSNGSTRSGKEMLQTEEYPYLLAKECPKDIEAKGQLQTVMLPKKAYEIVSKDSAGYILEVKEGEESFTGEAFREKYGLPSSSFELQEYEGKIRITTKGVGHGLGMSQYTANEMAKEKKTYQEILQYFFEGTEVKEVAQIL